MSQAVPENMPVAAQGWLGWKIISLLGKYRRTVACLAVLILIASVLDIAVPFLTQRLIDSILHSLQNHQGGYVRTLMSAAAAIFAATVTTRILRSFYNYRLVLTASRAEDEVKNAAFANFLSLDTAYHGKVNTGEIAGALDRGSTAIFIVLNEILGQNLFPPLLIVTGVLISLLMKNPWIAMMVFTPLPAYVVAINRLGPRMQETEQQVSRAFELVTKESYDIASNVRVVKKFGREPQESRTQQSLLHTARMKHHGAERLWAVVENLQSFIATAGRVGVIGLGGYFVLTHRCSVGDYVLYIAMQDMVYGPISQLSIILPKLRRNLSRAERLFEVLEERPRICDAPHAKPLLGIKYSIEFRHLHYRYPGCDCWTLEDVNFSVPAGATVALIGPSGSGKTTLMNLLQRLYDPQEGAILIDGEDLRSFTQRSLREQISVVPQEVELFSRTIIENIGYGRDHIVVNDVEQAARIAHAHEFIQRTEQGYETQVGERGAKLSGGERQRIGIARAIVKNPKVLILDEATSHLDNESERLIHEAMETIIGRRTCFIIAHRLSTVRNADLVVVFADGGIEAVGTHEQLWSSSPTYRKLYGLHLAGHRKSPVEEEPALRPAVGE